MLAKKLFVIAAVASASVFGQASILSCQATANPPVVRAEGITERTGDINLNCFGGQPNAVISGNLNIFLNVSVSNRIRADGTADAVLLIDNGNGFQAANVAPRASSQFGVTWAGLVITLSNEGKVNLRIQNVRAAAAQLNPNSFASIVATLTFNSGSLVSFLSNGLAVGTVQRGLFTTSTSQIVCSFAGSPSPEGTGIAGAVAKRSFYSTVRVTEGFPSAFAPLSDISNQLADSGTRLILRYSGLPAGARIFTPRFIVGNDTAYPTSAGDFGYPVSGGIYESGKGVLLMVRVSSTDANGGGGSPSGNVIGGGYTNVFDELTEVTYTGDGNAFAIYEVLDADSNRLQSALIPSFLELLPLVVERNSIIRQDVLFASVSSLNEIRTGASTHMPRYVSTVVPQSDCALLGDCKAQYFPRLAVNANGIEVLTDNTRSTEYRYLYISNSGSGNLLWSSSMRYISGGNSQWLRISPDAGINNETIQLNISPSGLSPGTYVAEVIVDAGPVAGLWPVQVTLRVGVGPPPTPIIYSVSNAANRVPGPLVAGSLAAITGSRFTGRKIEVYFNSLQGRVVSDNPEEIVAQVPLEAKELPTALVTVISDGVSSAPYHTYFAQSAPAIFQNYILNSDFSINAEFNPEQVGKEVHVFGTGMPLSGVYTASIHDRENLEPTYAGVAPGLIGIQQVTYVIPRDLPGMTTDTRICGGPSRDDQTCSPSRPISIREAPQP